MTLDASIGRIACLRVSLEGPSPGESCHSIGEPEIGFTVPAGIELGPSLKRARLPVSCSEPGAERS